MQFEADYFDGISPRAQRVLITIRDAAFFHLTTERQQADGRVVSTVKNYPIHDCYIQAKLGSGRRLIDCPDGSRIETSFQALEDYLPKQPRNTFWQLVHYAESHWGLIAIALFGIVLCGVYFLTYGVPTMAHYVAKVTPVALEADLGKETLATLDHEKWGYFGATALPKATQDRLQARLANLCAKVHDCPAYTLHFRTSPVIGANAFALPGGQIVIADELVEMAKSDDEIIAVLAHELGHVQGRHALRQTLQGTISGIIIIAITGDVSSIAAGLPAAMVNMQYTRELETEADQFALAALQQACLPTKAFATMLLRLTQQAGVDAVPQFLASHPATKARIAPFFKGQPACT